MTNIEKISLFTDEIYTFKMPHHDEWEKEIKTIIKVEENKNLHAFSTMPEDECNVKAKRTAWDSHIRYNSVNNIVNEIKIIIKNFIEIENYDAPNLHALDCWINWYEKNQYAIPHSHIGNLSVVYFIDIEKTNTKFLFHKNSNFELVKKKDLKNFFRNTIKDIPIENGTVVMFPSRMLHSVTPNLSDNRRITLAINFGVNYEEERKEY
jgi:uncharacterized protein (TIGR02466 family)